MASTTAATATDAAWESRQLLFVYAPCSPRSAIPPWMRPWPTGKLLGPAYIHGWLYDLGDYPGVKPVTAGTGTDRGHRGGAGGAGPAPKVWGSLMGFPDPETAFAALDRYEGFDPASPEAGEFDRSVVGGLIPGSDRPLEGPGIFLRPIHRRKGAHSLRGLPVPSRGPARDATMNLAQLTPTSKPMSAGSAAYGAACSDCGGRYGLCVTDAESRRLHQALRARPQVLSWSVGMLSLPGMNRPRKSSVEEMNFWIPGALFPSEYIFHE